MILPTAKTPPKRSLSDFTILAHGVQKSGKSDFASHFPDALFLATEPGLNALEVYQAEIRSWEDFLQACRELAEGKHPFKTVVVDTVDIALRLCSEHVCRQQKIQHESDLGFSKGYSLVGNEFQRVLTKLAFQPFGLILISHSIEREIETRTGRLTKLVPSLPDKARRFVVGLVDLVLYLDFETSADEKGRRQTRRVLRTKPNEHYVAGDRTGHLPDPIDLDYEVFASAFAKAVAEMEADEKAARTVGRKTGEAKAGETKTGNAA